MYYTANVLLWSLPHPQLPPGDVIVHLPLLRDKGRPRQRPLVPRLVLLRRTQVHHRKRPLPVGVQVDHAHGRGGHAPGAWSRLTTPTTFVWYVEYCVQYMYTYVCMWEQASYINKWLGYEPFSVNVLYTNHPLYYIDTVYTLYVKQICLIYHGICITTSTTDNAYYSSQL